MRFVLLALACATFVPSLLALSGPFDGKSFRGRIAYSSDGNHNDEDDWAASPTALAIFAGFGVQDRLVHFDYNCILPKTDSAWEKEHETSVLGAAERYGFNRAVFRDCRKNLDAAVDSIARAINASSADNPLYWVLAGPMEVPFLGIQKSDPAKRRFVYTISHSRWNDGFAAQYTFPYNKRAVIPTGIHWIQIQDQNTRLKTSPYGRPAEVQEWNDWHWMRDSKDEKLRFLWDRLRATKRADASDSGMAYFLLTGDEEGDIGKLRKLIEAHQPPMPLDPRPYVRLEAENFLSLGKFQIEDADRQASHRLNLKLAGERSSRISIPFDQPYTKAKAQYGVEVRYSGGKTGGCGLAFLINGKRHGDAWKADASDEAWRTWLLPLARIATGDEIAIEATGGGECRLDYVHLTLKP